MKERQCSLTEEEKGGGKAITANLYSIAYIELPVSEFETAFTWEGVAVTNS